MVSRRRVHIELPLPGELEGAVGGDLRRGWGAGQGGCDTRAAYRGAFQLRDVPQEHGGSPPSAVVGDQGVDFRLRTGDEGGFKLMCFLGLSVVCTNVISSLAKFCLNLRCCNAGS